MTLQVKIQKLHKDAIMPEYAKLGDAGFDLVAVEDVTIAPGSTTIVPTGLAFEIPAGYEMQVRPRSGISRKTELLVMLGTVDSGYRGEIGVIVKNLGAVVDASCTHVKTIAGTEQEYGTAVQTGTYLICKGDRIAQGVISPVITANFVEVDELVASERGTGGFGSTGVKIDKGI